MVKIILLQSITEQKKKISQCKIFQLTETGAVGLPGPPARTVEEHRTGSGSVMTLSQSMMGSSVLENGLKFESAVGADSVTGRTLKVDPLRVNKTIF